MQEFNVTLTSSVDLFPPKNLKNGKLIPFGTVLIVERGRDGRRTEIVFTSIANSMVTNTK